MHVPLSPEPHRILCFSIQDMNMNIHYSLIVFPTNRGHGLKLTWLCPVIYDILPSLA